MSNPFIKPSNNFTAYVSIWILLALVHFSIFYLILKFDASYALKDSVVFNLLYFGIGLSLWFPSRYITFENNSVIRVISNHVAGSIITSIVWVGAGYLLMTNLVQIEESTKQFLNDSLVWRFLIGILFYSIIVSLNYLIIYYTNFQEKKLKESELNTLIKEAELKTLKYQINPHFIFNSLNSISSLTLSDPKRAQEMTIKLSSFLRGTLSTNETQKTKLSDEINNVRLYLDIEKIRFNDKFDFSEEISDDCQDYKVPNMLLQPLFENAIKHGVYESIEKINIKLSCEKIEGYIKIIVENEYDPETVSKKGEGIGLKNIQNRLSLIYGQDNLLKAVKKNGMFTVNIFIPLEKEKIDE